MQLSLHLLLSGVVLTRRAMCALTIFFSSLFVCGKWQLLGGFFWPYKENSFLATRSVCMTLNTSSWMANVVVCIKMNFHRTSSSRSKETQFWFSNWKSLDSVKDPSLIFFHSSLGFNYIDIVAFGCAHVTAIGYYLHRQSTWTNLLSS